MIKYRGGVAYSYKSSIFVRKSIIMKKFLLILFAVYCSLISFARSVNDVEQIIVGEWYEEKSDIPGWVKYNADGTGSIITSIYLFEDSLGDFTWYITEEDTLKCVYPNNEVFHETISIIDSNTILLNGSKYIRRGSKKVSSGNISKSSQNVTHRNNSNNEWHPSVNSKDSFFKTITHPFDIKTPMGELTIASFKNCCNECRLTYHGYNNSEDRTDFLINRPIELFDEIFDVHVTFFKSAYNPITYRYYSSSQKVNLNSKLENIVQKLKSWGIELSNRIIRSRDGSERREGYVFKLDKNTRGDIYIYDNKLIILLDYVV